MQVFSKTDIGRVRKSNQDACFTCPLADDAVFAVVCDGMGGANGGNVASKRAIDLIGKYVERSYKKGLSSSQKLDLLQNAITSANASIYACSLKDENLRGMGTTVVAAIVDGDSAVICHVGDSRAYKIGESVVQITRDHSVVQNLVESGKLTPEQARKHPKKNIITRALGVEENIISDTETVQFCTGECLMLCTDGLTNFVDTADIKKIFDDNDINAVTELLTETANSNGGGDNITVVVIKKG